MFTFSGALVDTGYFIYNHMILPALIVLASKFFIICLVDFELTHSFFSRLSHFGSHMVQEV